jgi:hypothetical protein
MEQLVQTVRSVLDSRDQPPGQQEKAVDSSGSSPPVSKPESPVDTGEIIQ